MKRKGIFSKNIRQFLKPDLDYINGKYLAVCLWMFIGIYFCFPTLVYAEIKVVLDNNQVYSVRGYHDNDASFGSTQYRQNAIELINHIVSGNLKEQSAETVAKLAGAAEVIANAQSINLEEYNASLENMKNGSYYGAMANAVGEAISAASQTLMTLNIAGKKGLTTTVLNAGIDALATTKGISSSAKGVALGVAMMDLAQSELTKAYDIKSRMEKSGAVALSELNALNVAIENAKYIGVLGAGIAEQSASTGETLGESAVRHLGGLFNAAASGLLSATGSGTKITSLASTVVNLGLNSLSLEISLELDEKIKQTERELGIYQASDGKSPVTDPAAINEYLTLAEAKGFKTQKAIDIQIAEEKKIREEKISQDEKIAKEKAEKARLVKEEAELKKKQLEAEMAKLEKDLNAEAGKLDSLTNNLKSAGDINQLKAALDKASKDYDDNTSRRRMLTRQVDDYNEALKQLTGKIKVYEVTIRGVVYKPEDIPTLQSRVREQEKILNTLVREFEKPGGLEDTYDTARNRYNQLVAIERQKQEQEAALEKAQQELATIEANLLEENKKIEQAQKELLASDWQDMDIPAVPSLPTVNNRDVVTCMAIGCEDGSLGFSPIELDRKQNKMIEVAVDGGSASPSNPGGNPENYTVPLFMGQFRQLPFSVNTERVDPYYLLRAALGGDYQIADWNDLKAAYNSDPAEFTRQWTIGMGTEEMADPLYLPDTTPNTTNTRGGPSITRNGNLSAGRTSYDGKSFDRVYQIGYHDGQTPGGYAVHDRLGANEYVLGSWVRTAPYIAKKSSSDSDYSFDKTAGPATQETWAGQAVYWTGASIASSGTVVSKDFSVTLNPIEKRIESINIDGTEKTIYRTESWERATYYYGKNYMGVAYGDIRNYQDPNQEFGWAVTTTDGDLGDYDYMSWGLWQENTSYNNTTGALTNTEEGSHWIAGRLTPVNEIPTNSGAIYSGSVVGTLRVPGGMDSLSGTANLHADFGSRSLTGQFNNMQTSDGSAWKSLDVNAGWNAGVNSISGTLSGDGATGTVKGNFFGYRATELGGTWQTSAGAENAAGIFRGKILGD